MVECTALLLSLTVFTGQYLGVLVLSRSYSTLSEPVVSGNCQNHINMACRATDMSSCTQLWICAIILLIAQNYRAFHFFEGCLQNCKE